MKHAFTLHFFKISLSVYYTSFCLRIAFFGYLVKENLRDDSYFERILIFIDKAIYIYFYIYQVKNLIFNASCNISVQYLSWVVYLETARWVY